VGSIPETGPTIRRHLAAPGEQSWSFFVGRIFAADTYEFYWQVDEKEIVRDMLADSENSFPIACSSRLAR